MLNSGAPPARLVSEKPCCYFLSMSPTRFLLLTAAFWLHVLPAGAGFSPPLTPEQQSWLAKARRSERAGWIYLHIEGEPRARGFQHGYLLAKEIAEACAPPASGGNTKAPWIGPGWSAGRRHVRSEDRRRESRRARRHCRRRCAPPAAHVRATN